MILNHSTESKIIISNVSTGQIFEDLETDSKTSYSIADKKFYKKSRVFEKVRHLSFRYRPRSIRRPNEHAIAELGLIFTTKRQRRTD